MSEQPFFSVVIPVYNKEPHIARAINSVLNQTFQDYEIVIVCDPSTDNSNAEVAKFTDPRIRVFHRDEPGPGGYAARNLGINEANAEWIAFLDADDEWYPEHLSKMKDLSETYPSVYFMGCGWEVSSNKGIKADAFYKLNNKNKLLINAEGYFQNCINNLRPVHTSIACVNKLSPVAKNLFPADSGAKRGGDLHAWLKMICHHKEMTWSNHIGVRYFLDIEGQVVKSAPQSLELYSKAMIFELRKQLTKSELKLLDRYLNKRLFGLVLNAKLSGQKLKKILDVINFRNDFLGAVKLLLVYLLLSQKLALLLKRVVNR
jgi:glycosyltransferase involved in cell wall biosynthesis